MPGNGSAVVSWTAPANNGSAITGYVVTPYIGFVAQPARTFNSTATTQTITGLTNGDDVHVQGRGQERQGTGPPVGVVARGDGRSTGGADGCLGRVPGNGSATVSWMAPANNGSTITGYVVTPYVGTVAQPARTFNSTATSQTITGLTNGDDVHVQGGSQERQRDRATIRGIERGHTHVATRTERMSGLDRPAFSVTRRTLARRPIGPNH